MPGPVAVRPVYAPALVAFVGGVGISIGGGPGVGWFPLAPGEVYVPYYRGSRGYVERVNVTNTVVNVTRVTNIYNQRNVTNITYVNQRVNNGVTLVSRDTFVNARPVARNLGRFDARQLADARVERRVDVQPIRASVLGSGQLGTPVLRNPSTDRPLARPQQPVSPPETAVQPQMPRPDARPQRPIAAPRVAEPVRPEGQMAPRPPQGAVNQNDNNRFSQGWSHPQAKPAPPVQERNPAQARDDENKFRNWQQQRQQAAPVQSRAPQEQHQAPHQAPKDQDRRPKSQG